MCNGACHACTASLCDLRDPGWGDPGFRHCDFFVCVAPLGHLVMFWLCAVVSRMTRSGPGTQAALSLRLIAAIGYTIPSCDVLLLFLGFGFLVFALFVCFCFVCFSWLLVFCFLQWNGIIYICTTNQVAFHSIGSTCSN